MKSFLNRHSLIIGLVLMFLYTWTIDLSNADVLPFEVPFPIYITLGWGFIFASLLMTRLTVCRETPASAATCLIVTAWRRLAICYLPPSTPFIQASPFSLSPRH